MALSIISQARRLLACKKYNDVIRLLEPHVLEYRDSFAFHFYIGLAYLSLGEMGNAKDYFLAARKLKPNDPDLMASIAVMALRRHDTGKAIEYYLRILETKPNYVLAKQGLLYIRKYNTAESMGDFIRTGKIKKLYPMPSFLEVYSRYLKLAFFSVILVLVLSLAASIIYSHFHSNSTRQDITALNLDSSERKKAIDMEGAFRDVLTHAEVVAAFSKAQEYFQSFRDNMAQVEINKVLNSNATFSIKQKATALSELLKEPRFDTIKDIFSYQEVQEKPYLYKGCYVIWRGMPTNLNKGENTTTFDLLVGYDTKQRLEGTVSVYCNFSSEIDVEKSISVLSQIELDENGKLFLRAITIHQSIKPIE